MDQLMEALLTDSEVRIQIADNLPDKVQAQYIPNQRTIYVRNGMSENTTFHSISRELAYASLDRHDGSYSRAGVAAQAYCAAYVTAQKYGVDVSGFSFDKVCEMQAFGQKDPKELRSFIQDVKSAAYSIGKQVDRNLGKSEQEFMPDEFASQRKNQRNQPRTKSPRNADKRGFSGSFAVAFREEVWYVVVEKKEEKRRLAYDKNAICKDGPDHEHMLIHALREVFRQEKEQGLPVDTTRDLVLKLAEQEEGKLYLTEAEHTKSVEALNKLRDTYLKNGRYSDGIDSVLLKIMKSRYRRPYRGRGR